MKKLLATFWLFTLLLLLAFPLFGVVVQLEYYGEMGCSHCDLFQEKILPGAVAEAERHVASSAAGAAGTVGAAGPENAADADGAAGTAGAEETATSTAGLQVEAEYFDILSESGFERCEHRLAEMGLEFSVFPVLIIGNNAYQGNSAVEAGLAKELNWFAERGEYLPKRPEARGVLKGAMGAGTGRGIAFWPVFLAGLIDGVNPCAFATMLFFLSWISLRGGSRRRMVIAASGFILGVFAAYLVIGYGFFSFLRAAGTMGTIRSLVRYLFAGLAFLFALLSLRDAWSIHRSDKASSMLLKLPKSLKRRIHSVIKEGDRRVERATELSPGSTFGGDAGKEPESVKPGYSSGFAPPLLFFSLLITGMFVSVLELACTGQIYFPTIAYMVQSGEGTTPLLWLLLYNTAFILPLLGVFILVLAGVSRQRIGSWFEGHLVAGKVATALLFLVLGVMILIF